MKLTQKSKKKIKNVKICDNPNKKQTERFYFLNAVVQLNVRMVIKADYLFTEWNACYKKKDKNKCMIGKICLNYSVFTSL